jgi:dienelactone hydrolase
VTGDRLAGLGYVVLIPDVFPLRDGTGMSVIVFETREQAEQAAAYPLPPLPGVTPLTLEIREVYASA